MSQNDSPEWVIRVGKQAERLLADEAMAEACKAVEKRIMSEWRNALTPEAREHCHARMIGLEQIMEQLAVLMGDKDYEEAQLESGQ